MDRVKDSSIRKRLVVCQRGKIDTGSPFFQQSQLGRMLIHDHEAEVQAKLDLPLSLQQYRHQHEDM
jgi:hypothetical protein